MMRKCCRFGILSFCNKYNVSACRRRRRMVDFSYHKYITGGKEVRIKRNKKAYNEKNVRGHNNTRGT
jgi:hypothetical protein